MKPTNAKAIHLQTINVNKKQWFCQGFFTVPGIYFSRTIDLVEEKAPAVIR